MTLKTKKPDQGATEIFISEFEKRKSLECHVQNIQKPQCVFDHLNYRTQPNIYERLFLCE